jgi:hypothetical protein
MPRDRRRDIGIKTQKAGTGRILNIIEGADYKDTHGIGGDMTFKAVVNKEKNLVTESRIDRIYAKGTTHMEILDSSVIIPYGIVTPHRLVMTRIRSEEAPHNMANRGEEKRDADKMPSFGKQTKNRMEQLARILTDKCKPRYRGWLEALQKADDNVEGADKAAEEIIGLLREQTKKRLGGGGGKYRSNKERKLKDNMTRLLEIREMIKRIIKGDTNILHKDKTRFFRKIKKTFLQTWHIEEKDTEQWEERLVETRRALNEARREWKKEVDSEENKRRKKSKKNNFETAKEILEYMGGGDPGTVIDPETERITAEPDRVKEVIGEHLNQKIGIQTTPLTEKPKYQIAMEKANSNLRGTFEHLLREITKNDVREIMHIALLP